MKRKNILSHIKLKHSFLNYTVFFFFFYESAEWMAHWVIRLFCSWMIQRYFEWILWMNGSLTHLHVLFLNDSALLWMNLLKEWLIGSLAFFVLKWIRMNNNKKNCHDVCEAVSSGSTTWTWFDHRCDCRLRVKSLVITDIAEAEP